MSDRDHEIDEAEESESNSLLLSKIFVAGENFNQEFPAILEQVKKTKEELDIPSISNFTGELEEGWNLALVPHTDTAKPGFTKGKPETKVAAILAFPIPSISLLSQSEKGLAFIENAVNAALIKKASDSIRTDVKENFNRLGDDKFIAQLAENLPETLSDFLDRKRGKFDLEAWDDLAPKYLKMLREEKHLSISKMFFRNVLSNAAHAKFHYPKVSQEIWEKTILFLIKQAQIKQYDTSLFEHWLATRDVGDFDEITTDNLADLFEGSLSDDDDSGNDDNE